MDFSVNNSGRTDVDAQEKFSWIKALIKRVFRRLVRTKQFTIRNDGDSLEIKAYYTFLVDKWPSYITFWEKFTAPITKREEQNPNRHFKEDSALLLLKKNREDLLISQLLYSMLAHLLRSFELSSRQGLSDDQFFEGMIHVSASVDLLCELVERLSCRGKYPIWPIAPLKQVDDPKYYGFKKIQGATLQPIRDYRNFLAHSFRLPGLVLNQSRLLVPRIGVENKYQDWRLITNQPNSTFRADFDFANIVMREAWDKVISEAELQLDKFC